MNPAPNPVKQQAIQLFQSGQLDMSRAMFEQYLAANPLDFDACFFLGVIAFRQNNKPEAITFLEKATSIKEQAPGAYYQLGIAYRDMKDLGSSIRALSNAVKYKTDFREAYLTLADILSNTGRYRELADLSKSAIKALPGFIDMHVNYVFSLERCSKDKDALDASKAALELGPDNLKLNYTLAKLEVRNGNIQSARDRLIRLLQRKMSPFQYSAISGELGDIYDRLQQYDMALEAYQDANKAISSAIGMVPYETSKISKIISSYKECMDSDYVFDISEEAELENVPLPIFIVGFPRSGTTLIEQIVSTDSAIVPSDEKPVLEQLKTSFDNIFSNSTNYPCDLKDLSGEDLNQLRLKYFDLAETLTGNKYDRKTKLFLDKLPLNIIEIGLINRLFPNAKIITAIRDPRDCCLSSYFKQFVPNEAMNNFTDITNTGKFYNAVMGLWQHYKNALSLDYIEIKYEDLVLDFEGKTRELMDFLGLEWSEEVLNYHKKAHDRNITTPSYSSVSSKIYDSSVARWVNYEKFLNSIDSYLRTYIQEYGYDT